MMSLSPLRKDCLRVA